VGTSLGPTFLVFFLRVEESDVFYVAFCMACRQIPGVELPGATGSGAAPAARDGAAAPARASSLAHSYRTLAKLSGHRENKFSNAPVEARSRGEIGPGSSSDDRRPPEPHRRGHCGRRCNGHRRRRLRPGVVHAVSVAHYHVQSAPTSTSTPLVPRDPPTPAQPPPRYA